MYKKSLSLLAAVLLVTGCSTKSTTPYQSKATLDASISIVNSQFTLVTDNNESLEYPSNFGIISAIDNAKTHYTLVSPTLNGASADRALSTYDLIHASVLTPSDLESLLEVISMAVDRWNIVYDVSKGQVLWKSVLNQNGDTYFSFYNNAEGVKAAIGINTHEKKVEIYDAADYTEMDAREKYILLNEDEEMLSVTTLKYDFAITSLAELKGVQKLLKEALAMSTETNTDVVVSSEENNVTLEDTNASVPVLPEDTNATAETPIVSEETNSTVATPALAETPVKETTETADTNSTK